MQVFIVGHLQGQGVWVCCHLADELIMAKHTEPPHHGVVLHTAPAQLEPVGRGEVDGLRQVVAVVEAGVVAAGEGDDELAGVLVRR